MCEMPCVFEQYQVKARKDHECCECRGVIRKGELYTMTKGLWDGSWYNYKTCFQCREISEEIRKRDRYANDYLCFEGLLSYIGECCSNIDLTVRFMKNAHRRGAKIHWSWKRSVEQMKGWAS